MVLGERAANGGDRRSSIGLPLAWLASRLIAHWCSVLSRPIRLTIAAAIAILVGVGVVAAAIPARRAAHVESGDIDSRRVRTGTLRTTHPVTKGTLASGNAVIGSTVAARRAGSRLATAALASNTTITAVRVSGSKTLTPNN